MGRYSITGQIGIHETALITLKELGWIFKEQPVSDYGIDAHIEEVVENDPTGKIIAVQIKSGSGNFSPSGNKLIHYVSNIHKNYWLSHNLPVILIAHLPDDRATYWKLVDERSLKSTKSRWKIEIPYTNVYGERAKNALKKIISQVDEEDLLIETSKINESDIDRLEEEVKGITISHERLVVMTETLDRMNEDMAQETARINSLNSNGNMTPIILNKIIDNVSKIIDVAAQDLGKEIVVFADNFGEGLRAYEKIVIFHYSLMNDISILNNAISELETLPPAFREAIPKIKEMKQSVISLPTEYKGLKKSRLIMIDKVDTIINELEVASHFSLVVLENFKTH